MKVLRGGLFSMHTAHRDWASPGLRNINFGFRLVLMPPALTTLQVLRGGSFFNNEFYLRAAYRYRDSPDYRYVNLGFRLVITAARED